MYRLQMPCVAAGDRRVENAFLDGCKLLRFRFHVPSSARYKVLDDTSHRKLKQQQKHN
jgi:hypothetical protein